MTATDSGACPDAKRQKVEAPSATAVAAAGQYKEYAKYYDPTAYPAPGGLREDAGLRGQIIDGKAQAQGIRTKLKDIVARYIADGGRQPGLTVVLVGDNAASKVYVRQKQKACDEVGVRSELLTLPSTTTRDELLKTVQRLNADNGVDGILVQLPLPEGELRDSQSEVLELIDPSKDVDGFHPYNVGRLVSRSPTLRPCTPWGVMHLIRSTGANTYGLDCLVVGASNHVGRPMALELLLAGASVTVTHRFTRDLPDLVRRAECVVVAAGKAGLVKAEWIRPGAIVIDVGINRIDGKLCGDVADFPAAKERAGWITPVPGGVGPMTVAMLLQNTVAAYEARTGKAASQSDKA